MANKAETLLTIHFPSGPQRDGALLAWAVCLIGRQEAIHR